MVINRQQVGVDIVFGYVMNSKNLLHLLYFPLLLLLFSCAAPQPTEVSQQPLPPIKTSATPAAKEIAPSYITAKQLKKFRSPDRKIIQTLRSQYRNWKGTPYRLGGLSKKGVDCSGFVYLTYRLLTDARLPRTTRQQVKLGRAVDPRNLRAGDLLFFKTGWAARHVGIYHASTKKGVIISKLSEQYWRDAFWIAKRL